MRKKKKTDKPSGLISGFLNFLGEATVNLLKSSFIGKVFSSNRKLERKALSGVTIGPSSAFVEGKNNGLRRSALASTDRSFIVNLYRKLLKALCSCRLNWFGIYFSVFGVYTLIVYLIGQLRASDIGLSWALITDEYLVSAIFIVIGSIPLLYCKDSLKNAICNSRILRPVLENFFGIPENKFRSEAPTNKADSYFLAVILGIITGGLTHFVSPIAILITLAVGFTVPIFMIFPELGTLVTIFTVPFLSLFSAPTTILALMVSVNLISYLSKVFIGKRSFSFKLTDAMVLLFGFLLFMGGVVTLGGEESLKSATIYAILMTIYFLVVNLFNTREWIKRCIVAIALPSAIVAFFGIMGYAQVKMPLSWLDTSKFSDIASRATAFFSNPNMLSTYLILTAPFIWILTARKDVTRRSRAIGWLGALLSAACVILTWSRGGWLGFIAALLMFLLINNRGSLKFLVLALISSPLWYKLIPSTVTSRFLSIGNLSDSSTYYRLYTWKGSVKLLADYLWGGIGVGESAFTQLYPLYSYIGTETTVHSHNLFLQIAIELGIVALIVFLLSVFLIFQKGFTSLKNSDNNMKLFTSAAMSGLLAALVHGMVDYVWYNYRVFFIFFVVFAVVCACERVEHQEWLKKSYTALDSREQAVSLDIVFGN